MHFHPFFRGSSLLLLLPVGYLNMDDAVLQWLKNEAHTFLLLPEWGKMGDM